MNHVVELLKKNYKDGIFVGLVAFVASYLIAFFMSVVINVTVMDTLGKIFQGSIGFVHTFSFVRVIRLTSILLNLSVFNSTEEFQLGLLIFGVLPTFAFWLGNRKHHCATGFLFSKWPIYLIASVFYSILLAILTFMGKGAFLGMEINFFSFGNFGSTLLVVFCLQVLIGLNYSSSSTWIQATKWMFRLVYGLAIMIGIISLFKIIFSLSVNIFLKLGAVFGVLLNLASYISFTFMGMSIRISETLNTLVEYAKIDLSFSGLPIGLRIGLILIFFICTIITLLKLEKENYLFNLLRFAGFFSAITTFVAFCSTVYIRKVVIVKDIAFGIHLVPAFFYPFCMILIFGLLLWLFRRLLLILKEV